MLQARRSPVRVSDEVDFFNLANPSSHTMALGSTQPLTKMSTRNLPGVKSGWRVGLIILPPSISQMSEIVGASTSHNPKGLQGLYRDNFTYMTRVTDWHVANDIFLLRGHKPKQYGTAVVYYTYSKSTNSPYFKEQMTKCMKMQKILLKDCSLTSYTKTANFENLYTHTWIHSQ
jgi:hypothetical protein